MLTYLHYFPLIFVKRGIVCMLNFVNVFADYSIIFYKQKKPRYEKFKNQHKPLFNACYLVINSKNTLRYFLSKHKFNPE